MKIVDANVLLHAINRSSPDHAIAKKWLDEALNGGTSVGLAWGALLAVVRLATRPGLFERSLSVDEVAGVVRGWLNAPTSVVVEPGARHLDLLASLLQSAGTAGNLVSDAHLAALAIEHKAGIVTFDADFDRFPGIAWSRPT